MQKQLAIAISFLAGVSLASAQSAQIEFKQAVERFENKTVAGIPYSAKALTTSTQTLADGTKITRTITALLARDSDGRTRREQSMDAVGPWATNSQDHVVFIQDPIAQKSYIVEPRDESSVVTSDGREPGFQQELKSKVDADQAKLAAEMKHRLAKESARQGAPIVIAEVENKAQIDDLGEQVIEGVRAKGRRETRTIPVGAIGNDRPIQVVSEVWYSDELQAIVLSKRSDPRIGESEYRLTEISRAEPVHTLFEVPSGYSLRESGKRE